MNGRIYDPQIGRFLSADTVIDGPNDLQGYNRYSYVQNRPLTYNDPDGHVANFVFGAIFGGGIDLAAQVLIEGKSLKEVNYARVAISAAAGATGVGLGNAVAQASRIVATTAAKQIAVRAVGNTVAGAALGAVQTAATNSVSSEDEKQSVSKGALFGGVAGGVGSLAGDAAKGIATKLGDTIEHVVGGEPTTNINRLAENGILSKVTESGVESAITAAIGETATNTIANSAGLLQSITESDQEQPTESSSNVEQNIEEEKPPPPPPLMINYFENRMNY